MVVVTRRGRASSSRLVSLLVLSLRVRNPASHSRLEPSPPACASPSTRARSRASRIRARARALCPGLDLIPCTPPDARTSCPCLALVPQASAPLFLVATLTLTSAAISCIAPRGPLHGQASRSCIAVAPCARAGASRQCLAPVPRASAWRLVLLLTPG